MQKFFSYIFIIFIIGSEISCKKTPENIGLNIQPEGYLLNAQFTDSTTLITHTLKDDSIRTDEITPNLIGVCNDPVFGITSASVYTQLALSKTTPAFGNNPVLDSAVLSLVYKDNQYYGTLTPQKFKVCEMIEPISKDSIYFSNKTFNYTTEFANSYLTPNPKDSVKIDGKNQSPQLRIQLDKNFFQKFLEPALSHIYSGNAGFQNFLRGFYISSATNTVSGEGAILFFDLMNINSGLTLYYKNTDTTAQQSYSFGTKDCARFGHFEHDYSLSSSVQKQITGNPSVQHDTVFVQSMAGVQTKITIPFFMDYYKKEKISINKAELIIKVLPSSIIQTTYTPPSKLMVVVANDSSAVTFMPDYFEGDSYFGGNYDAANQEYRFNIARYLQQILNGTRKNNGLCVIVAFRPSVANRVQLIGGNKLLHGNMRIKLTYTPLKYEK